MKIIVTGKSQIEGRLSLADHITKALQNLIKGDFSIHCTDMNTLDISDIRSIEEYSKSIGKEKVDILINCAGVNDIDWIENFGPERWDRVMDVNAKGMFYLSRSLLDNLRGGTILNIVSNASHVPMTNSACYNASKGAAHIMTKSMARELGKTHGITVFGISPNKLSGTNMSTYIDSVVPEIRGWTEDQAKNYQLSALPAGEETDPSTLAEFIAFLLSSKQRHKYLQGCILPYGA